MNAHFRYSRSPQRDDKDSSIDPISDLDGESDSETYSLEVILCRKLVHTPWPCMENKICNHVL